MPAGLPSISYASVIIGFLSFSFTFFTFVRVFWATIVTIWSAPEQMKIGLDQLRTELNEERLYYRTVLKRYRSTSRGRSTKNTKTMYDDFEVIKLQYRVMKDLLAQFEVLEVSSAIYCAHASRESGRSASFVSRPQTVSDQNCCL